MRLMSMFCFSLGKKVKMQFIFPDSLHLLCIDEVKKHHNHEMHLRLDSESECEETIIILQHICYYTHL